MLCYVNGWSSPEGDCVYLVGAWSGRKRVVLALESIASYSALVAD